MIIIELPLKTSRGRVIRPRACLAEQAPKLGKQPGMSLLVPGGEEMVEQMTKWLCESMIAPLTVTACWSYEVHSYHTEIEMVGLNIHLENIVDYMSAFLFWDSMALDTLAPA